MKRILETFDAEAAVKSVKEFVKEYRISLEKNVISITTDGASVMKKFGRMFGVLHQQCYNHGINLAVIKRYTKIYKFQY